MPEQSSSTPETTAETVIVDIPTANRYSALQETTEPPGKNYSVNPPPSSTPEKVVPGVSCHSPSATVKPNSAVFLCDSNGKFSVLELRMPELLFKMNFPTLLN